MPVQYDWIVFDADDTLFHFDDLAGLQRVFSQCGQSFSEQDYRRYKEVNQPLWVAYQNGELSADALKRIRFEPWEASLGLSAAEINSAFLQAMVTVCQPLTGARELLSALQGRAQLGIITNGFSDLQQARLQHNGFDSLFSMLVISELVGVAKPDPKIFDHAKALMAHPDDKRVLMVGDNPHTDILGGQRAGFDTCWLNHHGQSCPQGVAPSLMVSNLAELQGVLLV
ncbi:pyrimidine 5'-nucleotidase [Ferrimonas aestuarii]|uniref:Pyrimidine 5'-nucleotidase n=1 Tax=Ferrimonas aestuarii TaxID=2569539 RepID=A0A4U1BK03_9GAMM|nr:pyrimidine 5'-nucleotidase [Ferrimonas aestuarii]TKB51764.1 pyrimidine 5'-nucleotidase [Ferrimonas aestuarii]